VKFFIEKNNGVSPIGLAPFFFVVLFHGDASWGRDKACLVYAKRATNNIRYFHPFTRCLFQLCSFVFEKKYGLGMDVVGSLLVYCGV